MAQNRKKNRKFNSSRSRGSSRGNSRWVVGIHSSAEAIKNNPKTIAKLWVKNDWKKNSSLQEIVDLATKNQLQITPVESHQLDKIASSNQGIALEMDSRPSVDWQELKSKESARVLVLDGVEDPQNLGAILRSSWLLNVDVVITPDRRSANLTPTTAKVASGGAEHVPLESVSNLSQTLDELKESGFWVYGMSHRAEKLISEVELPAKVALVMGSEDSGIRKTVAQSCDEMVRLPQSNKAASFNVSVATAMALYEIQNQQQTP